MTPSPDASPLTPAESHPPAPPSPAEIPQLASHAQGFQPQPVAGAVKHDPLIIQDADVPIQTTPLRHSAN